MELIGTALSSGVVDHSRPGSGFSTFLITHPNLNRLPHLLIQEITLLTTLSRYVLIHSVHSLTVIRVFATQGSALEISTLHLDSESLCVLLFARRRIRVILELFGGSGLSKHQVIVLISIGILYGTHTNNSFHRLIDKCVP